MNTIYYSHIIISYQVFNLMQFIILKIIKFYTSGTCMHMCTPLSLFVQVTKTKWCWNSIHYITFYFTQIKLQSKLVLPYFKHWKFQNNYILRHFVWYQITLLKKKHLNIHLECSDLWISALTNDNYILHYYPTQRGTKKVSACL